MKAFYEGLAAGSGADLREIRRGGQSGIGRRRLGGDLGRRKDRVQEGPGLGNETPRRTWGRKEEAQGREDAGERTGS